MKSSAEIAQELSKLYEEQSATYKRLYEINEGQLQLNEKLIVELTNKCELQAKLIKHLTAITEQYEIMVAERDELIKQAIS